MNKNKNSNIKQILSALGNNAQAVLSHMSDESIAKLSDIKTDSIQNFVDLHESLRTCLEYIKEEKNIENGLNIQGSEPFSNETLDLDTGDFENDNFDMENLFEDNNDEENLEQDLDSQEPEEIQTSKIDQKQQATVENNIDYKLVAQKLRKDSLQKKSFFIQNLDKDEQKEILKFFTEVEINQILSNTVHTNKFADKIFKTLYTQYYSIEKTQLSNSNNTPEEEAESQSIDQNDQLNMEIVENFQEESITNALLEEEDIVMSDVNLS